MSSPIHWSDLTAKAVTLRYDGKQYYRDRKLPAAEIQRMRQVLTAYESL